MYLADDDKNIICEVARVNLQPDDVLILDFKEAEMPQSAMQDFSTYMHEAFPNNKIVFLSKGVEIKVINGGNASEYRN